MLLLLYMYPSAVALHAYNINVLGWNRRLRSVLQGITCKMIDKVADNDTKDMAEAVAETPQWLSKVQVHIYSHTDLCEKNTCIVLCW